MKVLHFHADEISDASGNLCVSSRVLNEVFNYFIFSFSSMDMGDGGTKDIVVVITDNQDILYSNKTERDEANKLLEEREQKIEEQIATTEQEEAYQKDIQDRQDVADKYNQAVQDNPEA